MATTGQIPVGQVAPADAVIGVQAAFKAIFGRQVHWTLVSQDDGTEVQGQFAAQDLTENVGGVWSEAATLGLVQPILQWVRGGLETIGFNAKAWAKHQGVLGSGLFADDILEHVDIIRNLPRPDPKLGRPHIWLLAIGSQFQQLCVVRSVGGIKYDRFRGSDGSIRGVMFSMDLARYEPYDIEAISQLEAESLVTPAREGETYEHIAARELGDPLLGVALRRRNPERVTLAQGDLVHVPRAKILREESFPLTPQSLFLKSGTAQRQNLLNALEDRGGSVLTRILKTNWGG